MSTLPNILPAANPGNAGSFANDDGPPRSATTGNGRGGFDDLMSRALSPSTNPANDRNTSDVDAQTSNANYDPDSSPDNFTFQPKSSQSSSSKSESGHAKKSAATASPAGASATAETQGMMASQENVSVQIPVPDPASVPAAVLSAMPAQGAWNLKMTAEPAVTAGSTEIGAAKNQVENGLVPANKTSRPAKSAATNPAGAEVKTEVAAAMDTQPAALVSSAAKISISADGEKENAKTAAAATVPDVTVFSKSTGSTSGIPGTKTTDSTPSNIDGTSAAQQDLAMNSAEKMTKTTTSPGKILPGDAVSPVRENNLPVRAEATATNGSPQVSQLGNSDSIATASASAGENSVPAAFHSAALDRANELIALQASRLTASSASALQVVINPGQGTELSLNLRQRGDGVDAQAILQQGDYDHLSKHWPQLQQQLEQRGIRLAPLAEQTIFSGSGNGASQSQTNHRSMESDFADNIPGKASGTTPEIVRSGTALAATAGRRWETWA